MKITINLHCLIPQIGNLMTPVVSQGSDMPEVLKHFFEL